MKTFVRLLTLLLALLMLAMTVVACDDGNGNGDDVDRTATEDEFLRERDDLDQYNLNYMGEKITVLGRSEGTYTEFNVETISSDNLLMAIYDRNKEIERRMNVDMEFLVVSNGSMPTLLQQDKLTGQKAYDIIGCYSTSIVIYALQGFLMDINQIEECYINLEKPWWPDRMSEACTIGDGMYFFLGDMSPNVLGEMEVLFFNKDLLANEWDAEATKAGIVPDKDSKGRNLVSPAAQWLYDMVYDGTWTLDELIKFTMGADGTGYGDISGGETANVKDYMDTFGIVSRYQVYSMFYQGSNMKLIEKDDVKTLKVSEDYGSMKTVKLVQKLADWFKEDTVAVNERSLAGNYRSLMPQGRALFTAFRCRHAGNFTEISYGILPCPKYDAKQANYYTAIGQPSTIFGIYSGCDDRGNKQEAYSMISAVVECWASEGYRIVTPQLFEVNMQLKYADTQAETDMFEIVRGSICFDIGKIFTSELYSMYEMPVRSAFEGVSWVSSYAAYKVPLDKAVENIVKTLGNLVFDGTTDE